jgi:hypothetical protein
MARNQRGQLPVMSRKQERQTDHADSGRQGYECGWRLSFRPARSALRCWAVAALASESRTFGFPRVRSSYLSPLCSGFRPKGGALLAQAANRIAGALYGDDEKRLTPEVLIAAAAKATRLDAKPACRPSPRRSARRPDFQSPQGGVAVALRASRDELGSEADALHASHPRGCGARGRDNSHAAA